MKKQSYTYPFLNPNLSLDRRIKDLVTRLTLEEKIGLLPTRQQAIERLGIRAWDIGTEVARGLVSHDANEPTTVFPQPIGMAASFDPEMMQKIGEVAGTEARIYHQRCPHSKLMLWGPTVDMERDPRWGRTEEAYGEDPFLTGEMTKAYTKGLKGDHPFYMRTIPTLKHFCANNNEANRLASSSNLTERTKHEYYYAAFKPAITEGGAYSIMAAYNELNGLPALLNPDLKELIKKEWGLGFVVTDGGDFSQTVTHHHFCSTHGETLALAIKAGTDVMTDDVDVVVRAAYDALESGLLKEEEIDQAISQSLAGRFRLGEFDPKHLNPYGQVDEKLLNCDAYKQLNLEAAKKGMVLLKNEGILPLDRGEIKKVAVIGPLGNVNYRDWYTGISTYNISPLEGLREVFGAYEVIADTAEDLVALYAKGCKKYLSVGANGIKAEGTEVGIKELFLKADWGFDVLNYKSIYNDCYLREEDQIQAVTRELFGWHTKERFSLQPYKKAALLKSWNGAFLEVDEKNDLRLTKRKAIAENMLFEEKVIEDGISRAVEMARDADVVVVCVGNHPMQVAKECTDRTDITLGEKQSELIRAIYSVNKQIILTVISSYPYALNWEKAHLPAILYTSHSGPELGRALASTLVGENNPAGRLPMTWYRSINDLPDIMDYDIIKNEMTYQYFRGEVLYPFGHGLSYSHFEYTDLELIKCKEGIRVSFSIQNNSAVDGEEVAQVYFRALESKVKRPLKKLGAFKRIGLKAKEKKKIVFEIGYKQLQFWDVGKERFVVEEGEYAFEVGASSQDIRLKAKCFVEGEKRLARCLRANVRAICFDEDYLTKLCYGKKDARHYVTLLEACSWLRYQEVNLEGINKLEVSIATIATGSRLEVHIDDPYGKVIGAINVRASKGPEVFEYYTTELEKIGGVHDLYLSATQSINLCSLRTL